MHLDVFIDLTTARIAQRELEAAAADWALPERLGAIGGRVTIVTKGDDTRRPPGAPAEWRWVTSEASIADLGTAMDRAGAAGRCLLVVDGLADIGIEALGVLHRSLASDPMFGFAIPRVSCVDRCCIAQLTRNGVGPGAWLPRRVLAEIPDEEILLETLSACVLIAPQIAANFAAVETDYESRAGALLSCMAAARRCGFRTVCCNRAVAAAAVSCGTRPAGLPSALSQRDASLLGRRVADLARSWEQSSARSAAAFETLYAALPQPRAGLTVPSLLLDIRSVAPVHNGTTQAVLGLTDAFRQLRGDWSVSLLATEEGAAFHGLGRRFDWPLLTELPARAFAVALRLCQPWRMRELVDLHAAALVNACLLLDTIAWDVAYCAPPNLDGVWQFMAAHADGLLYDSEFTRQRFLKRFPQASNVAGAVTHFSFDPSDYAETREPTRAPDPQGHILVVGNQLDHKDVRLTVRVLATAFPYRHIEVLGPTDVISPLVKAHPSGALAASDIDRLFVSAACVVYPSFYEGFGFPMLTGLACGRTVFVRRSALVHELAPYCHGSGRLVPFDRREDLVELVGRLTAGGILDGLPLAEPGAPPRRWPDVANDTARFLSGLIEERTPRRWRARDLAVRQIAAAGT